MPDLDKEPLAQTLNSLIQQYDEWIEMANRPETLSAIKAEEIAFGQVMTRAQVLTDYLRRKQPALKVVSNG